MPQRWIALAALTLALAARAQTPTPVAAFDENKFTGTWYDVAHYPDKRNKPCNGDSVELIARADKPHQMQWVQSCHTSADVEAHNMTAKPQDKKAPDGRFKVTTFWPLTKKYWVLGLEADWALVGSPDHKGLWIYSRTAVMPPETLAAVKARAAAEGYPAENLVLTAPTAQ